MRLGKNFPGNGALPLRTHKPRLFGDSLPDVTLPPAIPPDFVARPLWDISIRTRPTWAPHRSTAARRSARKSWQGYVGELNPVLAGGHAMRDGRAHHYYWEMPENGEVLEEKTRRPTSGFSCLGTGPRVTALFFNRLVGKLNALILPVALQTRQSLPASIHPKLMA